MKIDSKNVSIVSIVFYVMAGLMILYSIFTLVNSYDYISELVNQGRISIKYQFKEVIIYYMNACMPYVFYSIVFGAIGYIINKLECIRKEKNNKHDNIINCNKEHYSVNKMKSNDDEIDLFLKDLEVKQN
ncbi:hypothetical protein [Clostridium sardiniense]|uniref:hypothetical protein n=1 Tax=Clostridium sardiniense TaxID=29369 RepID=UPI00195DB532|nr:hypothetical protein [Clostridium sardiniense]MBM7833382.1 TRAP-type C4-dicarboxylate transport system permease small subunit [Clostridium sardiniense]